MTEAVLLKIGCVVAILVGYGLLRWRIMVVTHAFRVQVGCDADRWADDERIPHELRHALRRWADRMYRPTTPWVVVLRALLAVLMPYERLARNHQAVMRSIPSEAREEVPRLGVKLVFAAVTTSPIASLATFLILMIGLVARASVEALGKRIEVIPGTYPKVV